MWVRKSKIEEILQALIIESNQEMVEELRNKVHKLEWVIYKKDKEISMLKNKLKGGDKD